MEGVIRVLHKDTYLISSINSIDYYACNLPDSIKSDGVKIYFCGEIKKIEPNEDVIGSLLKLTSVYLVTPQISGY